MNRTWILTRGPVVRRWVLLVAVFGVPTLFLRTVNDPVNVPKLSLLIVCVSVAAAIRAIEFTQGASVVNLRSLAVPAVAVAGPLFVAWLLSPYRGWAAFGEYGRFTGLIPYLLVVALAILVADAFVGQARTLAWAFAAAGAVAGAYALIQKAGLDPFDWAFAGSVAPDVVSSTLGNPDFVGGYLAICLPISLVLLVLETERRALCIVAVVLIAGGVLASFSQGGWGAAVAGAAVTGAFFATERFRHARTLGLVVAATIAAGAVGVVVAGMIADSPSGPTATRRADWWQAGIDMTLSSPVVGRGPSSFAIEHSRYRTVRDALEANINIENDPHNVPLAFSTGAGLLGLAGFLVFIGWGIGRGIRVADDDLVSGAFFGAFVAYVVQGMVSIDTVALRTAGWVALAGLVASTSLETEVRERGRPTKKAKRQRAEPVRNVILVALIAIVGAVAAYSGMRFLSADGGFSQAGSLLDAGDVTNGRARMESVLGFRDELEYRRTYSRQLGTLAIAAAEADEPELARSIYDLADEAFSPIDDLDFATTLIERARFLRDWSGVDPETGISDYSRFEYDREAKEEALVLFQRALEVDPWNHAVLVDTAGLALALDQPALAREIAAPVAARLDLPSLWGVLALASARVGQLDEAREAARAALALNPSDQYANSALELINSGDR